MCALWATNVVLYSGKSFTPVSLVSYYHRNRREDADTVYRCVSNLWSHESSEGTSVVPHKAKCFECDSVCTLECTFSLASVILSVFRKIRGNFHSRDKSSQASVYTPDYQNLKFLRQKLEQKQWRNVCYYVPLLSWRTAKWVASVQPKPHGIVPF